MQDFGSIAAMVMDLYMLDEGLFGVVCYSKVWLF
jgi:hypothetical protein